MIHRQELGFAGGVGQGDGDNLAVLDGDHAAVLLVDDEIGRRRAEARGEYAVIGAGRTAALIVTRNGDAGVLTGELFQLRRNGIGDGGVLARFFLAAASEELIEIYLCL